ncbi:MAG: hypothetical protein M1269_04975 [Chloroflexi bacterium]|nr:hypothetical protein [Chloroflexota bacterium]
MRSIYESSLFKVLALTAVLVVVGALSVHAAETVPHMMGGDPKLIAQFEGQKVEVEGVIVDTHIAKSGKVRFLNFSQDWKNSFTVVIFTGDLDEFMKQVGEPTRYYLGKRVIVTGKIKVYQGRPEIIVKRPDKIKVLF